MAKEKSSSFNKHEKGLYEVLIFLAAIIAGTACSITSKVLYDLTDDIHGRHFDKPIVQVLAMFVAMILGLPMHWAILHYQIPFPGYERFTTQQQQHSSSSNNGINRETINGIEDPDKTPRMRGVISSTAEEQEHLLPWNENGNCSNSSIHSYDDDDEDGDDTTRIPIKTYFYLIIPALFDCIATALCMVGLLYLDVSIYQLLRGSGIIFVALLRQNVLHQHLYNFQWCGVGWNVVSVFLVGTTAVLDASSSKNNTHTHPDAANNNNVNVETAMIGVAFMLAGTLVQAMMFVYEEKVMVQDEIKVPPLLLFGMEGLWGTILTMSLLYPIAYYVPGHDRGSFEDPWSTWEMLTSTPAIQIMMFLYCLAVFGYNLFAVLVTFSLSSIWHSILDNFRPMTVWFTDLFLFYVLTGGRFGEPWTEYSWIQLCGMVVLIYGTAIYNAPDVGSIWLQGEWYSLGMNFAEEYQEIQRQRRFSMGSYPSLQRFLNVSGSQHRIVGHGLRAHTLREKGSPKLHNYATLMEQHSI